MTAWGAESGEKTRLRCTQTLAMLRGVDGFSGGRYREALSRLMDTQYRVLLEAAPTRQLLKDPDAARVYRALPFSRRMKVHLKTGLPEKWFRFLKRGVVRR